MRYATKLGSSKEPVISMCGCVRVATIILLSTSPFTLAQESHVAPPKEEWLSGDLELGLDARRSTFDSDVELDQVLRLNIDPPKREQLHIRLTVWTIEDVDGDEVPTSTFRNLNDTSDAFVTSRVLRLYLEWEGDQDKFRIRVGRQRISDGVAYNRIDGVYLKSQYQKMDFYTFFGARASVYENAHDDISSGVGVSWRPQSRTRIALDLFYGEDERRRFSSDNIKATLTSLSLRQSLTNYHNIFGRAIWYEDELDEFKITSQGIFREDLFFYTLAYRKRLSSLTERPTDFPQFYQVVGEINGYEDLQAVVSVRLGQHVEVGLESQIHDADDSEFNSGNRDYQRLGLFMDINDFVEHYDMRIIVEFWDARDKQSEKTISGEISRRWSKSKATIGVDYDRFQDRIIQYGLLDQSEFYVQSVSDIYSFVIRFTHEMSQQHSFQVRASVEESDLPDAPYWRLRSQYTYSF